MYFFDIISGIWSEEEEIEKYKKYINVCGVFVRVVSMLEVYKSFLLKLLGYVRMKR